MNDSAIYMTTDEYLEFIHNAHTSYMKTRGGGLHNGQWHVADISINSADFFEVAFHVLTELGTIHTNRVIAKRQAVENLAKNADAYVAKDWQQTLFDALDEQVAADVAKEEPKVEAKVEKKNKKKTKGKRLGTKNWDSIAW